MYAKKQGYTIDPKELLSKPIDEQRNDWYNNIFTESDDI